MIALKWSRCYRGCYGPKLKSNGLCIYPIKTTGNFWTLVTKRTRKPDAPGQAPGSSSLFFTVFNSAHFIPSPLLFILAGISSSMSEPPFRPREKLVEKQKFFQSIHKHTYLKGPYDKITSVAIPLALAGSSLYLIVSTSCAPLMDFSVLVHG
ncbi:UNVERIFIED_CONTAM: hypothetical protein Sradi_0340100 [Sesamum radiatum]|uniref:Uncharacterized protein n=1 Tax=Sesamum radiatum TaxID=300843 RepID=A0AAW2W7Z1_SESRA